MNFNSGKPRMKSVANAAAATLAFVSAFMLAIALTGCSTNAASDAQPSDNSNLQASNGSGKSEPIQAPDVPLTLLDGSKKMLSEYQGKTVVLSFWGSWCPYCIEEFPVMDQIQQDFSDVEVLLVNCGEDAKTVQSFADQYGTRVSWVLDQEFAAQRAYPTDGIPYTVVIDPEGNVTGVMAGSYRDKTYDHLAGLIAKAQG